MSFDAYYAEHFGPFGAQATITLPVETHRAQLAHAYAAGGAERDARIAELERENTLLHAEYEAYIGDKRRAERMEAAARELNDAWKRWNANLAVIGGGADNMERFVALEAAFTALRAALAPAPEDSDG